jgi:integrase
MAYQWLTCGLPELSAGLFVAFTEIPMPKIAKRFVDSLQAGASKTFHWDDALKGFGVCVSPESRRNPNGRKSYVVQYRIRGSRHSHRMTLGSTSLLSPHQARDRALKVLGQAAAGEDPAPRREDEPESEPEVPTLRSFAARYMREHAKRRKKKRSWVQDQYYLDRLILPALGDQPLEEIAREKVAVLHEKIGARTPYQANRVLALLSVMFSKAIEWKLLPAGHEKPTAYITPFRERKRRRFLSIEELTRLGRVLEELESETGDWKNPLNIADRLDSIALIRLSIFTGCRKSELTKLCKNEIDRERNVLRLMDSKTGPKIVELPSPAMRILDTVSARHDKTASPYVFPGRDPSKPRGEPRRLWNLTRERAEIEDIRLHDLRRARPPPHLRFARRQRECRALCTPGPARSHEV